MLRVFSASVALQIFVVMILLNPSTSRAGGKCGKRVSAPLVEVKEIIGIWAKGRGCEISEWRPKVKVNGWSLDVWCGGQEVRIDIAPDSVLGTYVEFEGNRPDSPCKAELVSDLAQFLDASISRTETKEIHLEQKVKPSKGHLEISWPSILNKYSLLIACISVIDKDKPVQVSGIYLGRTRAILTTAHELEEGDHVRVIFAGKWDELGRVTHLDRSKDLALIELSHPVKGHFPSLQWRQDPLVSEDRIFYLGCPMGRGLVCLKGKVEIPRNMDGQLLWQVNMEVEPGSSGSPVFDESGRFAGVVKGRLRENHYQGFIIPVDTIKGYLVSLDKGVGDDNRKPYQLPIFKDIQ